MRLDDLPRLTDEGRELADDEYVVIPAAVPTNLSIDDLIAQRTTALAAFGAMVLMFGCLPNAHTPSVPCSNPESCR